MHILKHIPPSVILVLIIQGIYFIDFQSKLDGSVAENSKDIARNEAKIETLSASVQGQQVALARIDENITHIREIMERMSGE
jgi:uncharacterized coiled-coil protein SlyX